MYLGSSTREINEGVSRIDRILENRAGLGTCLSENSRDV